MMNKPTPSPIDIFSRYDAFIIDLWGVMHDGSTLYPGAAETLAWLHEQRKQIVFLSNAPRRATLAEITLHKLGIAKTLYDHVLTSGETAYQMLKESMLFGPRYYYLGPGKDEDVLDGLAYERVADPAQADFILNSGFEYDYQPEDDILPLLQRLYSLRLPLLCINPDIEVVKQDGARLLCAGWVAARYAGLGGHVVYIGKPHADVYARSFSLLGNPPKSRILAIGDNLHTDIVGANHQNIDCVLISGGILTSEQGHLPDERELAEHIAKAGATPTYVLPRFAITDPAAP